VAYTADDLETEVRRRTRLPTASDISSAEILGIADDEIATTLSDLIRNVDPSFWLTTHTATIVSGTATYALPSRAIGAGLERVELEDDSGNRQPVVALNEHDVWRWANGGRDALWTGRFAYIVEGAFVRLFPAPTDADAGLTLRVRYQRTPSRLTLTTDAASITNADTTTTLIITATPPAWVDGIADADRYVDIVRSDGAHELALADGIATGYSDVSNTVTLSASTPIVVADIADTTIANGGRVDYLCQAGETCYPQVPVTLWPVLVRAVTRTVLDGLGDDRGAARAQAILEQRIAAAKSVVTPRTRQVPTFVNHNSYLRRGRGWGG
jgi:hypothetical protein